MRFRSSWFGVRLLLLVLGAESGTDYWMVQNLLVTFGIESGTDLCGIDLSSESRTDFLKVCGAAAGKAHRHAVL